MWDDRDLGQRVHERSLAARHVIVRSDQPQGVEAAFANPFGGFLGIPHRVGGSPSDRDAAGVPPGNVRFERDDVAATYRIGSPRDQKDPFPATLPTAHAVLTEAASTGTPHDPR